jgi:hypothetical protein
MRVTPTLRQVNKFAVAVYNLNRNAVAETDPAGQTFPAFPKAETDSRTVTELAILLCN